MFSLLSLLDDVASTLDDVAIMSKLAVKKTSALMADDLAVNAGVVKGVDPKRELPIVRAIFLGSLLNKVYCISGVFLFMAVYPPIITVILFIGGLYLSYEGVHKIFEKTFKQKNAEKSLVNLTEEDKIKGAVRTDLILSIEIIVIAKNSLSGSLLTQLLALCVVGLLASFLIYGLVALIVKIDDFGLGLIKMGNPKTGRFLVSSMPNIMRFLGIAGTLAMLLVGGGVIGHVFHFELFLNEHIQNLVIGFATGLVLLAFISASLKIFKFGRTSPS